MSSQLGGTIELAHANRMSIRQLYNSYELDLLTETRRLSIYNITRTYVCRKQTQRVRAHFNVCVYVMQAESIKHEDSTTDSLEIWKILHIRAN